MYSIQIANVGYTKCKCTVYKVQMYSVYTLYTYSQVKPAPLRCYIIIASTQSNSTRIGVVSLCDVLDTVLVKVISFPGNIFLQWLTAVVVIHI